ncbi:predicted protein, partial [Nematostella vectensis]
VYLLRYHVFDGDSQEVEYNKAVAEAKANLEEYKKTATDLVDASTVSLLTDEKDLARGKAIYNLNCAACHAADGGGTIGPNLTDEYWILGGGIKNVFKTVSEGGRDGKGMVAWNKILKPADIQKVSSYILSLQGTKPANPKKAEAPFVKIDGNQFLLFNVLERKFNIFGFPFFPQDFHLFVISMIIGVVFIILFTVVFGRIFCGWICPQTIFMEMVFRKIEYWIEGDRGKQIRLKKQPWNAEKIRKRVTKWIVFFIISFAIANVFLAYLIGGDEVIEYITSSPFSHLNTLISLLIFTSVFYFVFAWFREQVCIIACPYGRLQGVLLDNKTINVAYDFVRGEKTAGRAKFKKNEDRAATGKGDCIDCMQCVHVCPTGIDIRNGTQLECVNCTACIDECDHMMEKVGLPKGLIRYASEDNIEKKAPFAFTARMKGYSAVLFILIGI